MEYPTPFCGTLTRKGNVCRQFPTHQSPGGVLCCENHLHKHVPIGDCPICIQECTQSNSVVTVCQHRFHLSCIRAWVCQEHDTCPVCRTSFNIVSVDDDHEIIDILSRSKPVDSEIQMEEDVLQAATSDPYMEKMYRDMRVLLTQDQLKHVFEALEQNRLVYFPISLHQYNLNNWYDTESDLGTRHT
jgi:hypothetical protein